MDVAYDLAAERIMEKIESYMRESESQTLTDEEQKEILAGILKVFLYEVTKLAVLEAVREVSVNLLKPWKAKKDGHLR